MTASPTHIETFARFATALRLEDVPGRVVEKARWQIASVLGCSFGGLHDDGARRVLAATRAHGGAGDARVLAAGFRTSRPAAVFANASLSCTFDFDEILLLGHPGHSSVTVPLVLAEALGRPFGDALVAQIAANEVMGRLGLATFLGFGNGQMLPFLHCAGAALAAGRVLDLDERAMAHALAIALAEPPAPLWPGFLGAIEAKILVAAHGASMGVRAAELAACGMTGALDLLDHPNGFFRRFTFVPFPRALGGLGRTWLSDTLQVKLNASCWYWQALFDALGESARALAAERGRPLEARDLRRVRCGVPFLSYIVSATESGRAHERLTANEVNFSIPMGAALLLRHGRLLPEHLTAERLRAEEREVRELAARIEVRHDAALSARLVGAVDRALDVAALTGSVRPAELLAALRRARRELPRATSVSPGARGLLGWARHLPAILRRLERARAAAYDLGDHDLASFSLPIPGAFEIELQGGRRIEGARDIEAGALVLPEAPARAAEKLEGCARGPLGAEGARSLVSALTAAGSDTPVASLWHGTPHALAA